MTDSTGLRRIASSYSDDPRTRVEVAYLSGGQGVVLREPARPGCELSFPLNEWRAFTDGVKAGEFDGPPGAHRVPDGAVTAIVNGVGEAYESEADGTEVAGFVLRALHEAGYKVTEAEPADGRETGSAAGSNSGTSRT